MTISWIEMAKSAIGDDAYRQLCETLPGRRIYVPSTCTPNHYLTSIIGIEKANALCDACAGIEIIIPITEAKRNQIRAEIKKGTKIYDIASKFYVHRRYVEREKRKMAEENSTNLQLPLI